LPHTRDYEIKPSLAFAQIKGEISRLIREESIKAPELTPQTHKAT
jgi:hypothetical protein